MDVSEFKDNISAMLHGGTLNKVRNIESAMQRAANTMLSKIDPIDTMRTISLSETVHNDIFNYSLPSDYKKIIDLYPQTRRQPLDVSTRNMAERFDVKSKSAIHDKLISIEGSEGSKIIRINWRIRQPKTINELNSLTANGTWSAAGSASNLVADAIDYVSGNGSVRFDVSTTGDGIENTSMSQVDLTDEDEVATFWVRFKIENQADLGNLNSGTLIWGNDLTANFWTGVAQTAQADGTAFKIGWNTIKFEWSTATETGAVLPAEIDSLRVTFNVGAAITNIRVDQITVSIGRNFDIKYYSKFVLKNPSGAFIAKSTQGTDTIVLDANALQIYILETLIACAHQIEGSDSGFDINWAKTELLGPGLTGRSGLYARYKTEYPSMAKSNIGYYGSPPRTMTRFR